MALALPEQASPSTPASGYLLLYPKDDGAWYSKNAAGVEAPMASVQVSLVDAKGDILIGTADNTPARLPVGTDGYQLHAQPGTTEGLQYLTPQMGFSLLNGYIDWTVSDSALTVAVKGWDGNDPSATNPVYVAFRSATATTGLPVIRKLTAATSIVLADTSTMGTINSTAFRLWCVAFDDGGTVRLALINCLSGTAPSLNIFPLQGWGIASATEETTGSDSAAVFYSNGAAVAAKAYAVIGYATWEAGLATAGTWSAGPTRKQLFGHGVPLPGEVIQSKRTQTGAAASGTTIIPYDNTIPQSTEGTEVLTAAITPISAANLLHVAAQMMVRTSGSDGALIAALFRDAATDALAVATTVNIGAGEGVMLPINHVARAGAAASTTFKIRLGPSDAATIHLNANSTGNSIFGGVANSYVEAREIMA